MIAPIQAYCVAAGVVALAIAGHFAQVNGLKTDLAREKLRSSELSAAIDTQNRAVKSLQAAGAQRRAEAAQALANARADSEAHRVTTDALQARILSASSTSCVPAVAEVRELLR